MMPQSSRFSCAAAVLLVAACGQDASSPVPLTAALPEAVDVTENMTRFVFDDKPVFEDGMPAAGNSFITQGYLYPGGFLEQNHGAEPDGSPSAPAQVIGQWTCRGFFVGDGVRTTTGPIVITTQLFDFYDEPGYAPDKSSGDNNLVTEGYELIDQGVAIGRAVTGGTGELRGARGETRQVLLGFNQSEGVNLRVELDLDLP
jgi:hypothetical protein